MDDYGSREVTERLLSSRMMDNYLRLSFGRWEEAIEPNLLNMNV